MFGWGNLIFVDLKWNKYKSLRNFQENFKFCNYLYWMSMRNNSEQRFGVDQYNRRGLAQFDKRRSAEREAAGSSPCRTNTQGL